MINSDFYPTPQDVIYEMIDGLNLRGNVLEPSAGKGDILDVMKQYNCDLYAIEIEPDLRAILESKGYMVIHDDFMTYDGEMLFDFIIMNPPFSDGISHALHAWEILADGGEMICLLNSVTLDACFGFYDEDDEENVHRRITREQRLLAKIIKDNDSKITSMGRCFSTAERPTNVTVSMLHLKKPVKKSEFKFDYKNYQGDPDFSEIASNAVARTGYAEMLVSSFDAAVDSYLHYSKLRSKTLDFIKVFDRGGYQAKKIVEHADDRDTVEGKNREFISGLQEAAWNSILDHPKFQAILTERARKEMAEFRKSQKSIQFNMDNIWSMFEALMAKQSEFLNGAIDDAFDNMTKYHKENRIYFEGWKSNECWRVARKVVLPNYVEYSYFGFGLNYYRRDEMNDIDRALCLVDKKSFDEITTIQKALQASIEIDGKKSENGKARTASSTFFDIKYYKKGTVHLTWKEEQLWKDFNLISARNRNWLPPEGAT
jgi:hypothetical protein